jgi:hypothetical protein
MQWQLDDVEGDASKITEKGKREDFCLPCPGKAQDRWQYIKKKSARERHAGI